MNVHTTNPECKQSASAKPTPIAPAWRIRGRKVVTRCPICSGVHTHGDPAGRTHDRVAHCSAPMVEYYDLSDEYRLDVRAGPAPAYVQDALRRDWPLPELATAFAQISDGGEIAGRPAMPGDDPDNDVDWFPGVGAIKFALITLRRCGAPLTAAALRTELASLGGRTMWRFAAGDLWSSQAGINARRNLLNALRNCFLQNGGEV